MDIEKILDTLIYYYRMNRQVGSTSAMIFGINNVSNAIVVAVDESHVRNLKTSINNQYTRFVTLSNIEKLRGTRGALIFDNYTIMTIFGYAMQKMVDIRFDKDIEKSVLKDKFNRLKDIFNEN